MNSKIVNAVLASVMAAALFVPAQPVIAEDTITVTGAGATFPYPIYSKWFDEYHKLHPEVQINYQSIGSGGGIKQFTEGTVDFGASDGPMNDEQVSKVPGKFMHLPTVLGGVVPVYNVAGAGELNFTGKLLADIYLGKVTKWSDKEIKSLNPGKNLPDATITVVHRADGSGTSYCFTDYLSKVSPEWKEKVGKGTSVNWPAGLGGKGNEGVSGLVKQTENSIGYVELIYALQTKMDYGVVKNQAGKFVKASLDSVSAAAAGAAKNMPPDYRVSITNAPGQNAYPISTFTWLLVKLDNQGAKGKTLKDFLTWELAEGQKMASSLAYAPLPENVKQMEEKSIAQIK